MPPWRCQLQLEFIDRKEQTKLSGLNSTQALDIERKEEALDLRGRQLLSAQAVSANSSK